MKLYRLISIAVLSAFVAACGGSSSGSFDNGGTANMNITPAATSVPANPERRSPDPDMDYTVQVRVRFTQASGDPVADGTSVTLTSENVNGGVISPVSNPEETGESATGTTSGGLAQFWFTSGPRMGDLRLTASGQNPSGAGTVTSDVDLEIIEADDGKPGTGPGMSVEPEAQSVPANPFDYEPNPDMDYTIQVNVKFTQSNGDPVDDGTQVSLTSSSSSRGVVSPLSAPLETGGSASATTTGGQAQFWFTSGSELGSVTLTAQANNPDPESSGETVTAETEIQIIEAEDGAERLRIQGSSTMPANTEDVGIFLGSPFITELTIRYTGPDGNAGEVADGEVAVAVSPVSLGAFSTLDDPDTEENEFLNLMGSAPVNMTAGVATIFVHSDDEPGTLTVSVSAQDAETNENFSKDFEIEIIEGAADFLPANLDFSAPTDPIYTKGSGGSTSKSMSLLVSDSGDNPVPDPEGSGAEYNNVTLSLDAPDGSDARLTGTGAEGSVSGTEINVQTVNGVANFSLSAGNETGLHRITATVDRADNNVDNDLIDPLTATTTVNVGDGQLFALHLVSPQEEAIVVNSTTDGIDSSVDPEDDGSGMPEGTYSLTVTAVGSDRAGNPPLMGQAIDLGKIDAPQTSGWPRFFVFSGGDGDPEEGGTIFTAMNPSEGFLDDPTSADEAVEAGDALAMFGKVVPGNREHEAVRTVASVVDESTVTVSQPFNPNDGSGAIVDDGAVIPWVIGRSQTGTIDASVNLDDRGVGTVQLTYPINALGQPIVYWAQGTRNEGSEVQKTVADVASAVFPGVAPAILTVQPGTIVGNRTMELTLCLTDALQAPINGAFIDGAVTEGDATVTIDGQPQPATVADATGSAGSGCAVTEVDVSNQVPGSEPSILTFSYGEASAEVQIVPPGAGVLLVEPSRLIDNSLNSTVRGLTLTLLDENNDPISGVSLVGECDSGEGMLEITQNPGTTDDNGETTATVTYNMAACGEDSADDSFPRIGQCEFTTDSGQPVGLLTVEGLNLRSIVFSSPSNPDGICPPLDEEEDETQLAVEIENNLAGDVSVVSDPEGINCGTGIDGGGTCIATFTESSVFLQSDLNQPAPTWSGDCEVDPDSSTGRIATVDLDAAGESAFCAATFDP